MNLRSERDLRLGGPHPDWRPSCSLRAVLLIDFLQSEPMSMITDRISKFLHLLDAAVNGVSPEIIDVDSKQRAGLRALPAPHAPEVSTCICAPLRKTTPLVPAFETDGAPRPLATAKDVVEEIEQAHDGLHRAQAILVHLEMTSRRKPALSEYLDEAQHTFIQALSRYEARDFEAARECAAASSDLCALIDILLSAFSSDDNPANPASFTPQNVFPHHDQQIAKDDLHRVDHLLARVQWVSKNGTLSAQERTQVEKLSAWGEQFCRWAHRLVDAGEEATELAHAAEAAVSAAEHLCRRCYVNRSVAPRSASASN
jgi:hypothetical protein